MSEAPDRNIRTANVPDNAPLAHSPHQKILDRWEKWKAMGSPRPHEVNKNMVNVFVCADGHETVTRDMAQGVTPALIPCLHPGCQLDAPGARYMVPDAEELLEKGGKWVYRWVRLQVQDVPSNDYTYWKQGGLLLKYGINDTLVWDNGKRLSRLQRRHKERVKVQVQGRFKQQLAKAFVDTVKAHVKAGEEPPLPPTEGKA